MEKHIIEKVKEILENEKDVKNISMYMNLLGEWVVQYDYEGTTYIVNIFETYKGSVYNGK